jgi:cell division protein FtsW
MFSRKRYSLYFRVWFPGIALIILGSVFVLSSSSIYGIARTGDPAHYFEKHLIWLLLGGIGVYLLNKMDIKTLEKYSLLLFGLSLCILPLPKLFGSLRWIVLGPFSFQPSELIKFTFIIYLADYLRRKKTEIRNLKTLIVPSLLLVTITGILQIQKDIGTFVLIFFTFILLIFLSGAQIKHIGIFALTGILLFGGLILMFPYRTQRIKTYLNPKADVQGAGYQTIQSLIAVGSGGIKGKGLGSGERKLKFLPEAHKDYIYAVVGEEMGFLGTTFVLLLFAVIVFSCFTISGLTQDNYIKLLTAGIGGLFGFQFLLHASVVLNIIPAKGTTLPFFSVGGSSFLINVLALGVLLNITRRVCSEESPDDFGEMIKI